MRIYKNHTKLKELQQDLENMARETKYSGTWRNLILQNLEHFISKDYVRTSPYPSLLHSAADDFSQNKLVNLSIETHKRVRAYAFFNNTSIREIANIAIIEYINNHPLKNN